MKKVDKVEYQLFLQNYIGELTINVCGISEPPAINHYDANGNLVAHTFAYSNNPNDYYYEPEEERYYEIMSD